MRAVGKIIAILDERHLLIQSDARVVADQELFVVQTFRIEALERDIYVPKGTVRVLLDQGEDIFLCERFRRPRKVEEPPFSSSIASLVGRPRIVEVPGAWSAPPPSETDLLGFQADENIRVGDVIVTE